MPLREEGSDITKYESFSLRLSEARVGSDEAIENLIKLHIRLWTTLKSVAVKTPKETT